MFTLLGGRKLSLIMICIFISTILGIYGKLDPTLAGVLTGLCTIYCGANMWQDRNEKKFK